MAKKILIGLLGLVLIGVAFLFYASKTRTEVHVQRTFNAPVARVWQLWNEPESIKKWWGPKEFTAPVIINDLRIGGHFLLSMKGPDGKTYWNTGLYEEVVPLQKITSKMSFAEETGQATQASYYGLPGDWPDEVLVKVEFKETDGKTTVSITEVGIPLIMKLFAGMGWEQQLDKFEKLL